MRPERGLCYLRFTEYHSTNSPPPNWRGKKTETQHIVVTPNVVFASGFLTPDSNPTKWILCNDNPRSDGLLAMWEKSAGLFVLISQINPLTLSKISVMNCAFWNGMTPASQQILSLYAPLSTGPRRLMWAPETLAQETSKRAVQRVHRRSRSAGTKWLQRGTNRRILALNCRSNHFLIFQLILIQIRLYANISYTNTATGSAAVKNFALFRTIEWSPAALSSVSNVACMPIPAAPL